MNKKTIQKLVILLTAALSLFFFSQIISAQLENKEKINASLSALSGVKFFKQTLQCLNCDLSSVNLSHYDPASLLQTPNSQKNCVMDISLSGANLSNTQMDRAKFIACGRAGTVTPFRKINFTNTNLSHAILSHTIFYGVSFEQADLSEAILDHAKLSLSDFSQANFSKADLTYTQSNRDAMQGWGANFESTNFSGADLSDASLYGFFQGADFSGANLKNTILNTTSDTVPAGHKPVKAQDLWKGVNFTDANLEGAYILTDGNANDQDIENAQKADLKQAIFCRTKMPDGSVNNKNCPAIEKK